MKKKRLGEILLEARVITRRQLDEALEEQKKYGGRLGSILLDRRYITEREFFTALTSQLGIPAIDFTKSTIPEKVISVIPEEVADKYGVFPVAFKSTPQGKVLVLAMSDPTNVEVQDHIRFTTGYKVEPALALETTIRYVIRDYFFHQDGKGSYRMESEADLDKPPDGPEFQVERPEPRPAAMLNEDLTPPDTSQESTSADDRPQLSRELKALLKLLHKKGIVFPREYLEAFKETK